MRNLEAASRRTSSKDKSKSTRSKQYETSQGGEEENPPPWKGPRKLGYALTALLAGMSALPDAPKAELSDPINQISPLALACVIPPEQHPTLDDIVHALRQVGNRAQMVVLPETAMPLRWEEERDHVMGRIVKDECDQYGVWVAVSMETPTRGSKHSNEVVLLSPNGVVGTYAKRSLFPRV